MSMNCARTILILCSAKNSLACVSVVMIVLLLPGKFRERERRYRWYPPTGRTRFHAGYRRGIRHTTAEPKSQMLVERLSLAWRSLDLAPPFARTRSSVLLQGSGQTR